jgi:hypothetical protein
MMNWKGCGKKRSSYNLSKYPGICLRTEEKPRETSVRISGLRARNLNLVPPEYEA